MFELMVGPAGQTRHQASGRMSALLVAFAGWKRSQALLAAALAVGVAVCRSYQAAGLALSVRVGWLGMMGLQVMVEVEFVVASIMLPLCADTRCSWTGYPKMLLSSSACKICTDA